MIEGARWKKWLWFYLPMGMFILGLLFPFYWMLVTTVRPDGELYRPWNHPLYMPFWTTQPTLDHIKNLLQETLFDRWMWNTMLIAFAATLISLVCGVLAGYALARLRFRYAGLLGTAIFITYLVPQTLLFIPLADIIREYRIGDTPWALILTYPTFLIPSCTWLMMGYFKTIPKGLEEISSGEISIDGRVVNDLAPMDRDIAMVFQNYALYPHMSVYDNMAFGLRMRKFDKPEIERRVRRSAEILGIQALLERKPRQ